MAEMTRKEFLSMVGGAAVIAFVEPGNVAAQTQRSTPKCKRGVTFYSYQEEYYTRAMTLEDCISEVASMGAEGVELIPEEMVPNYPNPPETWVQQWHAWMEKYQTKPACLDTFVDVYMGGHRTMSLKESVDALITHMKLANQLGFKMIRPAMGPRDVAPKMIEAALPFAEQYDIRIAPEIHAPIPMKGKYIDSYMEMIAKTKTKHLGFTQDMSTFCKRLPRVVLDWHRRQGAQAKVVRYLDEAFQNGVDRDQRIAEVKKMGGTDVDIRAAEMTSGYGPISNDPKDLRAIMPYVFNIHGKTYEMTDDFAEYSIPYDQIFPVLIESGYSGYINTEYEGQRSTQDIKETDSCEEVRKHHIMMRKLLGELS